MILEAASLAFGVLGLLLGLAGWRLAHRWAKDCRECRILIARKGKVALDANLVEWLSWNRALPSREQSRGGIIFHANGIQVALARPKIGAASARAESRTVKGDKAAA